jgi:hypothetical protein
MSREQLGRMDVDTNWPYHRKLRRLQAAQPERWPIYWAAYLALLGECWKAGTRSLNVVDAWCPAVPCPPDEAMQVLIAVGITDRQGRVPAASWREWYGPVQARLADRSEAGQQAAHTRWHSGPYASCVRCAAAMRAHSGRNAPSRQARPTRQTPPSPRAPARPRGSVRIDTGPEQVGAPLRALGFYPPGEQPREEHHE